MLEATVLFAAIYALNIIPAFAPPTWMALSLIGFNDPTIDATLLALLGALAATMGRLTLAKLSRLFIRQRILNEGMRQNIDAIKQALERRRVLTVSAFLFYAFSPLPSNYLFIAYGLTSLRLTLIALPFFLGRFISYNFWVFSAATAARHIVLESPDTESYLSVYFIGSQCFFLALVYGFTKIDWRVLLSKRKLGWLANAKNDFPGAAK